MGLGVSFQIHAFGMVIFLILVIQPFTVGKMKCTHDVLNGFCHQIIAVFIFLESGVDNGKMQTGAILAHILDLNQAH